MEADGGMGGMVVGKDLVDPLEEGEIDGLDSLYFQRWWVS